MEFLIDKIEWPKAKRHATMLRRLPACLQKWYAYSGLAESITYAELDRDWKKWKEISFYVRLNIGSMHFWSLNKNNIWVLRFAGTPCGSLHEVEAIKLTAREVEEVQREVANRPIRVFRNYPGYGKVPGYREEDEE